MTMNNEPNTCHPHRGEDGAAAVWQQRKRRWLALPHVTLTEPLDRSDGSIGSERFRLSVAAESAPVRHPELKLKTPAQVFCMSWCADFEYRVTQWGTMGPFSAGGA